MIREIMSGSLIRDTPPWARISAGTRSRAITETSPASSAILACSGVTTSMITPPLSISAIPRLTRDVPVTGVLTDSDMVQSYGRAGERPDGQSIPGGPACDLGHRCKRGIVDVEVGRTIMPTGHPQRSD